MDLQTDIYNTIIKGKKVAPCWSTTLINLQDNGENTGCCELKLMLLVSWVEILESYYCTHFDESYGNITPDYECLTLAQAQELLGKLKALID